MATPVFAGLPAIPRALPLATGQTIKEGDLVTLVSGEVQAIGVATKDFCGVAAENGSGSTIQVWTCPEQIFELVTSGGSLTAASLGTGYAPTLTAGQQTLNLAAAGNLRVVWFDSLATAAGSTVHVRIMDHQFSSNETDAERVPEPTSDGNWLRKRASGVTSWAAGVPTITGTTGHIPKIKADGTLETAGLAAANLQVLVAPAAANNLAKLTAGGALADAGKTIDAIMLRDTDGTVGDVCTLDANKDAVGSGLQLSGVARRANPTTAGNLAELDADGDPADSGIAKTVVTNLAKGYIAVDTSKAADFDADLSTVYYSVLTDTGNFTATLPATATAGVGKTFVFKKLGPANSLIVSVNAADTPVGGPNEGIDGAASHSMAVENATVTVVCARAKSGPVVGKWEIY